MKILNSVLAAAIIAFASPVLAQTATPTVIEVDCSDPDNAEELACLPVAAGVTNFAPLAAGAAGLLGVAALAGGGSTTSTTSTTNTTN